MTGLTDAISGDAWNILAVTDHSCDGLFTGNKLLHDGCNDGVEETG